MAITIGQANTKPGIFGLLDDWLKRDRFFLSDGLDYFYSHVLS